MELTKDEIKARIGTKDAHGNIVRWPKLTITGAGFTPPATTQDISATEFVVLPPGFTNWDDLKAFKKGSRAAVDNLPRPVESAPAPVATVPPVEGDEPVARKGK